MNAKVARTCHLRISLRVQASAFAIACLSAPGAAFAQDAVQNAGSTAQAPSPAEAAPATSAPKAPATSATAKDESSDSIIVTGTRDPHATAAKSLSPVSVVSAAQIQSSGAPDLRDALVALDPSVTKQPFMVSYASSVDKISLQGLPSNDTLVLINGVRRHPSANMGYDGFETGATPSDIGTFPSSAVERAEILRDGASAQYGSDAVAGVINFILKTNDHGLEIATNDGITAKGDGFTSDTTANAGFNLLNRGFLSVSGEVYQQDHAIRSRPDDREPIVNGSGTVLFPVGSIANKTFSTPSQTRTAFSYNAGINLTDDVQLYSFATYAHRSSAVWQNYRLPSKLPQVFPNGFTPMTRNTENDYAVTVGLKGTVGGWDWDISGTHGRDYIDVNTSDTVNIALYADTGFTPTAVHNGAYGDTQTTADLNIRRSFDVGMAGPVNLAFGGQLRHSTYTLGAGDVASNYGGGTQGAGGFDPRIAVYGVGQNVQAGYVDLALEPFNNFKADLAGRYEKYSDSGSKLTGKISARYDFSPAVALRGTVSTGFRAPTLDEQYFGVLGVTPNGAFGQVPVNSAAAKYLGATPLKPETSTNYSAGLVLHPIPGMTATLDAYQITIKNRVLAGGFYNGQAAITAFSLIGIGVNPGTDPNAVSAQYFVNGADTRTRGLNFVLNYRTDFGTYRIDWDASAGFTNTKILRIGNDLNGNPLLNDISKSYLTTDVPAQKVIFGGHLTSGNFDLSLHELFWGRTQTYMQYTSGPNAFSGTVFYLQKNKPSWATNIELGYKVADVARFSVGAQNLFNAFPTEVPANASYYGVYKYDTYAQGIGILGAYYYAGLKLTF